MANMPILKNILQPWKENIVAKVTKWLPQSESAKGIRSPHFWIITALVAFCTLLYYFDQTPLVRMSPFNNSFFTQVHDIYRILFFIPVVYAALVFRIRGSLIVSFAFLGVVLPRALLLSPYPDPLLRSLLFVAFAALISLLLAIQLNLAEEERNAQAERILRFERDKLAAILESMEDGAYIINAKYEVEYVNQTIFLQFGPVEERKCYQYLHDRQDPCAWCKIESVLEGRSIYRDLYSLRNGRNYNYIGTPFKNTDGSISKLGMLRDITERKRLELDVARLKEVEETERNLLTTVSHELRSPLATIRGYTSILADSERELSNGQKREFILAIQQDAERLSNFVNDLLDLSRLEAGLFKLEMSLCSIGTLLKRVVAAAQIRSPRHQILLKVAEPLPIVNIDVVRIEQVLNNLIDNATKYSVEGTETTIMARKGDNELLVGVSDQGIGIRAEDLEKVFSRTYCIEHKQTKASGSMGLGLSLCKGLVALHGGRIWVESKVGVGSTFWFTLPFDRAKSNSGAGDD
jgi:signal transduction histidine kinase